MSDLQCMLDCINPVGGSENMEIALGMEQAPSMGNLTTGS